MTVADQRYFVRSPDGAMIAGFELREAAVYVALEYGDGALYQLALIGTHFTGIILPQGKARFAP